jgi:hypothetical protein
MEAGRQWFEIWVPQDPQAWTLPKIVFPDISPEAKFFLDRDGYIVDGNCYWITTNDRADDDLLLLILGVANSSVLARYHELCFQNRLYAQRRRYLTQYVQRYPLPSRELAESQEIVRLARRLADSDASPSRRKELEDRIDGLVARAFGVDVDHRDA